MSGSATITPTTMSPSNKDIMMLLYTIIAIAVVGFVYLCVQCCICIRKARQYSSSGSFPAQHQPTMEDNRDESSSSSTSTQKESSDDYC